MSSDPLPVIDVGPLIARSPGRESVARAMAEACESSGFFYVVGHRVDGELRERLESLSREFFALELERKLAIRMERGGRAWRGYFPVGAELTLGQADRKEGLYFGAELDEHHPRVRAKTPLHGANLFPAELPELRRVVLTYIQSLTRLGHRLMEGLASSLGLDAGYFAERYMGDPFVLFRIFNYPALRGEEDEVWSVGEHTDYGVLTILLQDASGGLEVKTRNGWMPAPPIADSFLCNIGDMLDRMTGGRYRSTPHRVRNKSERDRLSFPFFFDPSFDATVAPIDPRAEVEDDARERWDGRSVYELSGTYGDYLVDKVSRVFPALARDLLGIDSAASDPSDS